MSMRDEFIHVGTIKVQDPLDVQDVSSLHSHFLILAADRLWKLQDLNIELQQIYPNPLTEIRKLEKCFEKFRSF